MNYEFDLESAIEILRRCRFLGRCDGNHKDGRKLPCVWCEAEKDADNLIASILSSERRSK